MTVFDCRSFSGLLCGCDSLSEPLVDIETVFEDFNARTKALYFYRRIIVSSVSVPVEKSDTFIERKLEAWVQGHELQ